MIPPDVTPSVIDDIQDKNTLVGDHIILIEERYTGDASGGVSLQR